MLLLLLALSLPADGAFQPFHEEDGVTVTIARTSEGPPWVRGVGEIAATPEQIVQVLTRYETWPELFSESVKQTTVIERQDLTARLHMIYPFPWPFRDRGAVVVYTLEKPSPRAIRLWWKDDARPGDPEIDVRLPRVEGETKLDAVAAGSRVRFTYLGELGMTLNEGMKRKIWRDEALRYFRSLRRVLSKDKL